MTTTGRRALLTAGVSAAAAAALSGCTSEEPAPRKPGAAELEAERVARAEAALRLRSVAASRTLLERYDAALAAHPALAPRLNPLRRSVAAHAVALGEGGTTVRPATAAPASTSSASASASASAKPTASPVPVATDPRAALRELAAAERTASDAHTAALLTAPPEYARLLASVAAAGAAHAYLLTEGARA
ncbi:hypothetical protein [Streptomyces zaomyceticus]|uniref:hypothetical protein n=1 Tax=Streptomyces zaomyceticus TaxID=68286 RepID=UPI001672C1B2|nr:hypothetical protein [Streptomyces zaomyceticus]GHG05611.1 hypothetical protein GCM10018791_17580 [Streptomyces zaomyceticus]